MMFLIVQHIFGCKGTTKKRHTQGKSEKIVGALAYLKKKQYLCSQISMP